PSNYAYGNFHLSIPADSLQFTFDLLESDCSTIAGPVTSIGSLIEDQWNHVVATFDGDDMTVYLNGSYDNQVSLSATTQACVGNQSLFIGPYFEGKIDEVAVYGVALDAEEVGEIYDYQASWFDVVYQHNVVVDVDPPCFSDCDAEGSGQIYGDQAAGFDVAYPRDVAVDLDLSSVKLAMDGAYIQVDLDNYRILTIDAFDEHSDVELVEYRIQGGSWQTATREVDTAGNEKDAWIFAFYPVQGETAHTIYLRATDSVGHVGTAEATVTVDNTAPRAELHDSMNWPPHTVDDSLTLLGETTDAPGSGADIVTVDVRDYQGLSVSGYQTVTLSEVYNYNEITMEWVLPWTADYPFPTPPYGEYTVYASTRDTAWPDGNTAVDVELGPISLDSYGPVADVYARSNVITSSNAIPGYTQYGLMGNASDLRDPIADKLVSFHFNNWLAYGGVQGVYVDSSGNFFNGECKVATGACPLTIRSDYVPPDTGNPYGGAVEFRAAGGDVMTISLDAGDYADEVLNLEDFSLGLWVKPTQANSGYQTLIRKDADGTLDERNFALGMLSDSTQPQFELQGTCGDAGTAKTLTATNTLPLDTWSHVMATYDDDSNALALYVNGVLDASAIITPSGVCTATHDIVIGENLTARMDELAIYDRALDEDEVYYLVNPLDITINQVKLRLRHASGMPYWPEVDTDAIGIYLPMDAGDFADVSSAAHAVSCAADSGSAPGCPAWETALFGAAARFDGDDSLIIASGGDIDPAPGFSAAAWFKVAEIGQQRAILWQEGGEAWLGITNGGNLFTSMGGYTLTTQAVAAGEWRHAALSYDGATLELYLDGVLEASNIISVPSNSGNIVVGGVFSKTSFSWYGCIDDVLV
ncbi:MAG: LamG domain-containing protein, partial [Anaerolineae bacterium]